MNVSLKPLTCHMEGRTAHASFDREQLRQFVQNTKESSFMVQDAEGRSVPMQVEPIRQYFLENQDTTPR